MPQPMLDEREFELINIIGKQVSSNQRDLSRHLDISLGMTNMLIRRLIEKGFIRIRQLNKKKVEYILTPKGFSEKMRKSVNYTLNTIRSIGFINKRLRETIVQLYEESYRSFFIVGESDLVLLVETVLKDDRFQGCEIRQVKEVEQITVIKKAVYLICTEKVDDRSFNGFPTINLIQELAKTDDFVSPLVQ